MSDPTKPDLTAKTPDDQVTYGGWSPLTAQDIANWTPGLPQTTAAIGYSPGIGPGIGIVATPIWCARPHLPEGFCAVSMEEYTALMETCSMQRAILRRHYPIHRNRYERRRQHVAEQATRHKLAVFKRKGFDVLRSMNMVGEYTPPAGRVQ